ncbi:cysteine-rich venom protein-like [Clytia hemisphaerica]|uniref:SCP domain-containing protein n=1 Tax=Clytia hemisphaerica TaxID=252671 RepID=A0A7M5V9P4_9CNID
MELLRLFSFCAFFIGVSSRKWIVSPTLIGDLHNKIREQYVDTPPLKADYRLSADAQNCAQYLLDNPSLDILTHPCNPGHFGENIYKLSAVSADNEVFQRATEIWHDEEKDLPDRSDSLWYLMVNFNNRNKPVGHFIQEIWALATKVGCGMASDDNNVSIVVCRYDKAVNPLGTQLRDNVHLKKQSAINNNCQDTPNFPCTQDLCAHFGDLYCKKSCNKC